MTMALAEPRSRQSPKLRGHSSPRIGPPIPAKTLIVQYEAAATQLGIKLLPWQRNVGRFLTAIERPPYRPRKDQPPEPWKYREIAVVGSRQNGKTWAVIPRIIMGLERGEQILHTAQNRDIPRKMFTRQLVPILLRHPELGYSIRQANGQEEINTPAGGRYKLVAPNSSSRGETADLVIIDEVREQHDLELMNAMLPTITARPNSQIIYLSNAGDERSIVLNDIRRRGLEGVEPRLAYLEWSAAPEREANDPEGWAEANPALGYEVTEATLAYNLANLPITSFETEHLCRWVVSMMPPVIQEAAWHRLRENIPQWERPTMGISVDPESRRASAAIAWTDGSNVYVASFAEAVPAHRIDDFAADLERLVRKEHITAIGYDPWTDRALARHFPHAKAINGADYQAACKTFAAVIESGQLRHNDDGTLLGDLAYTVRHETPTGWYAVRSNAERPTTASLAAIRAVYLATEPTPSKPKVH